MEKVIVSFKVITKTSKKGNEYTCIVAIDNEGREHFVCYTKK